MSSLTLDTVSTEGRFLDQREEINFSSPLSEWGPTLLKRFGISRPALVFLFLSSPCAPQFISTSEVVRLIEV